jgi:hypothetical protein
MYICLYDFISVGWSLIKRVPQKTLGAKLLHSVLYYKDSFQVASVDIGTFRLFLVSSLHSFFFSFFPLSFLPSLPLFLISPSLPSTFLPSFLPLSF